MSNGNFLSEAYLPPVSAETWKSTLRGDSQWWAVRNPELFMPPQRSLYSHTMDMELYRHAGQPVSSERLMLARGAVIITHNALQRQIGISDIPALPQRRLEHLQISEEGPLVLKRSIQEMGRVAFAEAAWEHFIRNQQVLSLLLEQAYEKQINGHEPDTLVYYPTLFIYSILEQRARALVMEHDFGLGDRTA
jgi:hypothetical protein